MGHPVLPEPSSPASVVANVRMAPPIGRLPGAHAWSSCARRGPRTVRMTSIPASLSRASVDGEGVHCCRISYTDCDHSGRSALRGRNSGSASGSQNAPETLTTSVRSRGFPTMGWPEGRIPPKVRAMRHARALHELGQASRNVARSHDGTLAGAKSAHSLVTVHVGAHLVTMVTAHVRTRRVHGTVVAATALDTFGTRRHRRPSLPSQCLFRQQRQLVVGGADELAVDDRPGQRLPNVVTRTDSRTRTTPPTSRGTRAWPSRRGSR